MLTFVLHWPGRDVTVLVEEEIGTPPGEGDTELLTIDKADEGALNIVVPEGDVEEASIDEADEELIVIVVPEDGAEEASIDEADEEPIPEFFSVVLTRGTKEDFLRFLQETTQRRRGPVRLKTTGRGMRNLNNLFPGDGKIEHVMPLPALPPPYLIWLGLQALAASDG